MKGLQESAAASGLAINVGIHEPASQDSPSATSDTFSGHSTCDGDEKDDRQKTRVKNTLIWIDEQGCITQRYQKLHLFDMDLPKSFSSPNKTTDSINTSSMGPSRLRESLTVEPGRCLHPPFPATALSSLRIGLQICFDMRFPLPSARLRDLGAQVLTYPSAFTVPTGRAGHWHMLLRARAIENQCWVFAAAQVGRHSVLDGDHKEIQKERGTGRVSYGHSLIVDPWGQVVAEAGGLEQWDASLSSTSSLSETSAGERLGILFSEPELILAEISEEAVERVREGMPLEKMARRDVIDIQDKVLPDA